MNILDRVLPVRRGDEIRFHLPNGSIRTVTLQGYMIGMDDGRMPALYAKLTDISGETYVTPYKNLAQPAREKMKSEI